MFILWRDTFTFYFIMYFLASPQRILVPGSGMEPVPLAVEGWNLNTGLPRKSLFSFYFKPYALNLQKLFTFDASFLFNNCVWLVPHLSFSIGIHSVYRYTLFHCALLILCFFFFNKLNVCGDPVSSKSICANFSQQHLLTLHLCITFWWFPQYLKFFIIIIFLMVISDQSCYFYDSLKAQTMVSMFSNI